MIWTLLLLLCGACLINPSPADSLNETKAIYQWLRLRGGDRFHTGGEIKC